MNKLFALLHAYVGFGAELNYLNFLLPAEGSSIAIGIKIIYNNK